MDEDEIDSGNFGGNKDLEFYRCQSQANLPEQVRSVNSAYLGNESSSSTLYEISEETDEKFYIIKSWNPSIMSSTDPASTSDLPETPACPDDAQKESHFEEKPCCSSNINNIMQVSEKTTPEENNDLLVKESDDIDVRDRVTINLQKEETAYSSSSVIQVPKNTQANEMNSEAVEVKKAEMSEKMLNQYGNQIQAIIFKTKCCFCQTFPKPPILNCIQGHKICELCSKFVPNCPFVDEQTGKICHKGITEVQCRLLQAVFESGLFQCTWKGCRKKLNGPEIVIHAKICPFRPEYRCRVSNCKATEPMTEKSLPIHIIHGHNIALFNFGPEYRQIPWLLLTRPKRCVIDRITKKRIYKEPEMFIGATYTHDGYHFFLFIAEMGRESFPWVAVAEKLPEDKKYWTRIKTIIGIDEKEKKYESVGPVHHYSKPLKEILVGTSSINSIRDHILSPLPMKLESPYSKFKMSVEIDIKEFPASPKPEKLVVTPETLAVLSQIQF